MTEEDVRKNQLFVVVQNSNVYLPTPSDNLVGMVLFFKGATGPYTLACLGASRRFIQHNAPMSAPVQSITIASGSSVILVCMKVVGGTFWVSFWCG